MDVSIVTAPFIHAAVSPAHLHNCAPCSCRWAVVSICPTLDCKTLRRPGCSCRRLPPPRTASCSRRTRLSGNTDTGSQVASHRATSRQRGSRSPAQPALPAFRRHMFMSATCRQLLLLGSYTSQLFLTRGPSWPPTAYSRPFSTPTPGAGNEQMKVSVSYRFRWDKRAVMGLNGKATLLWWMNHTQSAELFVVSHRFFYLRMHIHLNMKQIFFHCHYVITSRISDWPIAQRNAPSIPMCTAFSMCCHCTMQKYSDIPAPLRLVPISAM